MLFSDIIGQQQVKQQLLRTAIQGRISHAQLFLGESGYGVLALALAYAQYINCKSRTPEDACGTCPSCIKYKKIAHPDLHFIFPVASTKEYTGSVTSKTFISEWRSLLQSNLYFDLADWYNQINIENKQGIINAEDCNEILRILNYKSYESEYKVMIIWMVERLFHAAAPKLLKILEEPPEKTLFILIGENQDALLSTILSRTQILRIPRIENESLLGYLVNECGCEEGRARQFVLNSEGNLIKASRLISEDESRDYNFQQFKNWMRMCYAKNLVDVSSWVSEIATIGRERQKAFLIFALNLVRNCFIKAYMPNQINKLEPAEIDFINKFSPFIHHQNINQLVEELQSAMYYIERNANAKMVFLDASLRVILLLKKATVY